MKQRSSSIKENSIVPKFRGLYLERFLRLIASIDAKDAVSQREEIRNELAWCNNLTHEGIDRLKYRATLMVLSDIMGQGWRTRYRHRSIFLVRPDYTHGKHLGIDHALIKRQIRSALQEQRLAQINTPSTLRFIDRMECPSKGKSSIFDLLTSGEGLARDLRCLPENPNEADLRKVIDPYLQLIRSDETDRISGLKLNDIWRYLRYLWAIPYQSTPGRNMFYLVRDASRPNHPIIGISALGNCVVKLSERDQTIGWSVGAIEKNLERRSRVTTRDLPKASSARSINEIHYLESELEYKDRIQAYAQTLCDSMQRAFDHELSLIKLSGLATLSECRNPTDSLVRRLLAAASQSEQNRRGQLRDAELKGERPKRTEKDSRLKDDVNSPLYVRKRAQALAEILFARLIFKKEGFVASPLQSLRRMLQTDDGRKAIRIGLHSNKKTKIGSNMMDIIVCGAIPPYAEMLGGKLVAMLMASPQVVREYRANYGDRPGQIVSRLAGKEIVRPADLVFLTTTSLYYVGSSQYERIRIPGPNGSDISFEHIGMTEGFGASALSMETTDFLRELTIKAEGMKRINSIFGEGISPKLRMTRDGLNLIGVPDLVLRHDCPRLIYGVRLAKNAYEYLRGEATNPKYILPLDRSKQGTNEIVRHWLTRWFAGRARREESLEKVERFRVDELRLSREIISVDREAVKREQLRVSVG